jgi:GTP-binding protein HflX
LDELAFLVKTAGGVVVERFVQKLDMPDPRSFVGIGKLNELKTYIIDNKIDMVVFDDELSASQIRNIEKAFKCKVMDRSNLILDIFAKRARTAHAKTQVELAQYEYLLPRLTRMWTHLERQRGGIGMRGPGEREIETDRRIIRDRIALLKKKLEQFDKQKSLQRKNRQSLVRVALVGYTNVGKSTIMNLLSKSEVFAENKLFATLDTTVRKVVIGNLPFLISDTVGFIRKLPHGLIESFKSTLDETTEADIILHVVDISHPNFEEQIEVVNQTLAEINANDKPVITVFNKVDRYEPSNEDQEEDQDGLSDDFASLDLENTWMAKKNQPAIFISAKEKYNIDLLREKLYHIVKEIHVKRYPYNNFLY